MLSGVAASEERRKGMYSYYDLKPLCDQIHQEKLREAEYRHLALQAKTEREPQHEFGHIGVSWRSTLTPLLRGARRTGQAVARARKETA
jgi:hypothetical protein